MPAKAGQGNKAKPAPGKPAAAPGNAGKDNNIQPDPNKPAGAPDNAGQGNKPQPVANKPNPAGNQPRPGPQVIEIRPIAEPAKMQPRHWGVLLSLLLMVLLPVGGIGWYMWDRAVDQYASSTGFTVRSEEAGATTSLLGGFSQFVGGSTGADADVIFEFIQSQDMAARIDARLDLQSHYSAYWKQDPIFALKPGGTVEDLLSYWKRVVRVAYDPSSGLINIQVRAFDPEFAQRVAQAVIAESQTLVNELNATARADSLKYAQEDLDTALVRLKSAREALVDFRTRTQIVDPESDLQGRMGVLNGLQQQLAQALIDHDLLVQEAAPGDPRIVQMRRRIEVIRSRISEERANFATSDGNGGQDEAYPKLLAEYESLTVDRQYAEETYRVALASLDAARSSAARQTRYLATYLRPTLPQAAEYPRRWTVLGLALVFLFLFWSILTLTFYSLRDRR